MAGVQAQDVLPRDLQTAPTVETIEKEPRATTYPGRFGVSYAEHPSGSLKADVYMPPGKGPFPGVLVVHGGAWRMGSRRQLAGVAGKLAERGYVAVAINYRLAPAHRFPAQIDDCRQALEWMGSRADEFQLDPQRIGGFGYSAGAHLVTLLGAAADRSTASAPPLPTSDAERTDLPARTRVRLRAVVAGGAPCDFRPLPLDAHGLAFWLGGSQRECPQQYVDASPAAFATSDDPPMFFFHGEHDDLVPLASPQRMCAALLQAGAQAELYVAPRLGHMATGFDRTALEKAFAFLDRHLRRLE